MVVANLKINRISDGSCKFDCSPLPKKVDKNELRLFPNGMVPN
jgi:hypothetical protein